ncbi:hypothetical protein [Methylophilus sp. TWE2]|uniref:hypothetical protein n=1 Tax=Methylophilus sp. TWE2 TaxID=1662285 RepID=UPI0012E02121|nr:hypothetical protein [Methylophilus sp. TWE2]
MTHVLLKFKVVTVMLVLATLIAIPVIGSFMCISDDVVTHTHGSETHEIVNTAMGELGEHCCDDHTHHDINLIGSSSSLSTLSTAVPGYKRPDNENLIPHPLIEFDKPPSF